MAAREPNGAQESNVSRRKKCPAVRLVPPLMPLIDVMFTLLMFFLVAANVRQPEGVLPVNMPGLDGRSDPIRLLVKSHGSDKAGVVVTESGSDSPVCVFEPAQGEPDRSPANVAGRAAATRQLQAFLVRKADAYGKKVPIVIRPVDDPRWEHVVETHNQALRAGFHRVTFAAQ